MAARAGEREAATREKEAAARPVSAEKRIGALEDTIRVFEARLRDLEGRYGKAADTKKRAGLLSKSQTTATVGLIYVLGQER